MVNAQKVRQHNSKQGVPIYGPSGQVEEIKVEEDPMDIGGSKVYNVVPQKTTLGRRSVGMTGLPDQEMLDDAVSSHSSSSNTSLKRR